MHVMLIYLKLMYSGFLATSLFTYLTTYNPTIYRIANFPKLTTGILNHRTRSPARTTAPPSTASRAVATGPAALLVADAEVPLTLTLAELEVNAPLVAVASLLATVLAVVVAPDCSALEALDTRAE